MKSEAAPGSPFTPTLLSEAGRWLVLVPGYGGSVQTYECETEAQARTLLGLFAGTGASRRRPR